MARKSEIKNLDDVINELAKIESALKDQAIDGKALESEKCNTLGIKLDEIRQFLSIIAERWNAFLENEDKLRDAFDSVKGCAGITLTFAMNKETSDIIYSQNMQRIVSDKLFDACDMFDELFTDDVFRM